MAETVPALKGVALVIGQSDYANLPDLPNPSNDARAIDRLLSDLGFDVDAVLDGDRKRLDRAFERFREDAADADVALVYYSGHGIEAGGANFLVPVDSTKPAAGSVDDLVAVDPLLQTLQATVPIVIVLLDACRTNPYPAGTVVATDTGETAEVAPEGLSAPRGAVSLKGRGSETLGAVIGFAAEPGKAALDGEPGANSPYAAALLKHLSAGRYDFGDVMTMVSEEVYLKTAARQLPWTNASLRRLLYFGLDPATKPVDEEAITDGRRSLLLTIASTPPATRSLVEQVATANGVPLDALYGMLEVLGVNTADDNLAQHLSEGAARLKAMVAARDVQTRQDPEIARLAGLADKAETEGAIALSLDFRNRASVRADEIDRQLDRAESDIEERRLELVSTYRANAETASLNFDFATAARRYADAFEQAERFDIPLAYQLKVLEGEALADQGAYRGDNAALERSLAAYAKALEVGRASPDARRDANLKGNMAIVMTQLGNRSADTVWLDRATDLYRQVSRALPRKKYPEDWAYVQLNLGGLYQSLGGRSGDRRYFEEALKAYRGAAEIMTRDAAPETWAGLQMNIGNVYAALGGNGGGVGDFRKAEKAMLATLEIWTRDAYPVNWSMVQANLGSVLNSLGAKTGDPKAVRRAIDAHKASMEIATRERQPMDWASGMNNIGSAYLDLAELEGDARLYASAVEAYRSARTIYTIEVDPNTHAITWYNEGRALLFQGRAQKSDATLRNGQAALDVAVDILAQTNSPVGWARARSVLGEILAARGRLGGSRDLLRQARAAFEDARSTYARNGMGETGQGFWEKQIAAIDADLKK